MSILTRYLLRAHLGPLLFAFCALTGLLFLNTVAQRLGDFVGKGLGWQVVVEFAALSLPHTVALTFPMAVLVAVLYTFSDLTEKSEITAMTAGGVKPSRILAPIIAAGAVFTVGMFYFNDQILPEANHRLRTLGVDVANKSPTFELEEQIVNEVRFDGGASRYYLEADRIDRQRSELFDVAIYDVSPGELHRTTFANSGYMAFSPDGTDLYLTLYDGVMLEGNENSPEQFQRVRFEEQVVPLRGVGDILERRGGGAERGEREMTTLMLLDAVRIRRAEMERLGREIRENSLQAVEEALRVQEIQADAAEPTGGAVGAPTASQASSQIPIRMDDRVTNQAVAQVRSRVNQVDALERVQAGYEVEIHKKFALAFASLVFVLIGPAVAVRFPRGGIGMTIAVSVATFAVYWVGLMGGEKLAEEGYVHPAVAMWASNVLFFVLGVFMTVRMGHWVATNRGGGWQDLRSTLSRIAARPIRWMRGMTT